MGDMVTPATRLHLCPVWCSLVVAPVLGMPPAGSSVRVPRSWVVPYARGINDPNVPSCLRKSLAQYPNLAAQKRRPECSLVYQDDPGLNAVLAAMRRRGAAASKKLGTPECGPYAEGSASTGMSGGLSLALVRLLPRRSQTTTAAPAGTGHRRCHRALLSSTHMQDSLPGCGPASKPGSTNSNVLCPGRIGEVAAQETPACDPGIG